MTSLMFTARTTVQGKGSLLVLLSIQHKAQTQLHIEEIITACLPSSLDVRSTLVEKEAMKCFLSKHLSIVLD